MNRPVSYLPPTLQVGSMGGLVAAAEPSYPLRYGDVSVFELFLPLRNYQGRYIRTITTSFLLGNVPIRHTLCGAVMPVFRAVDPLLRYGYGGVPSCHALRATVMGSESGEE